MIDFSEFETREFRVESFSFVEFIIGIFEFFFLRISFVGEGNKLFAREEKFSEWIFVWNERILGFFVQIEGILELFNDCFIAVLRRESVLSFSEKEFWKNFESSSNLLFERFVLYRYACSIFFVVDTD